MAFTLNHIHLKTPDPDATVQWYVDNLGAEVVERRPGEGYRIDLHGLPINVSDYISTQSHQQVYGLEHIAINTDDPDGLAAKLTANGAKILEKLSGPNRRTVYFVEGPQGVMLEIVQMPKATG